MSKAMADLFWNQHYSDYVLAVGIGAALPVVRAALDAVVFKVGVPPIVTPGLMDPPRGMCGPGLGTGTGRVLLAARWQSSMHEQASALTARRIQ